MGLERLAEHRWDTGREPGCAQDLPPPPTSFVPQTKRAVRDGAEKGGCGHTKGGLNTVIRTELILEVKGGPNPGEQRN